MMSSGQIGLKQFLRLESANGLRTCLMGQTAPVQGRRAADACGASDITGEMHHIECSHSSYSNLLADVVALAKLPLSSRLVQLPLHPDCRSADALIHARCIFKNANGSDWPLPMTEAEPRLEF